MPDPFHGHQHRPLPVSPRISPETQPRQPHPPPRPRPTSPNGALSPKGLAPRVKTNGTAAPPSQPPVPLPRRMSADSPTLRGRLGGLSRGGRGGRGRGGALSSSHIPRQKPGTPPRDPSLPNEYLVALFDHAQDNEDELALRAGDIVYLHEQTSEEWFQVSLDGKSVGFVAAAFLKPTSTPPKSPSVQPALPPKPQRPSSGPELEGGGPQPQSVSPPALDAQGSSTENLLSKVAESTNRKLGSIKRKSSRFSNMVTLRKRRKSDSLSNFAISRTGDDARPNSGDPSGPAIQRKGSLLDMRVSDSDSAQPPERPLETSPRVDSCPAVVVPGNQRQRIAEEIVATEKHYIKVLNSLVHEYRPTLLTGVGHYGGAITKEDIEQIFCNLEMIVPLNEQLLADLEEALEGWGDESTLGDIFVRLAPVFKMYHIYTTRYDAALATLGRCSKNEMFVELMEGVDQSTSFTARLEGLLIAPIQRIPRYTLLLQELRKNTEEVHPDHALLSKAIPLMTEVADYINENIKQVENQNKLISLSKKGAKGLLAPHRQLLYESVFQDAGPGRTRKIHMILFNDMVVLLPDSKAKNAQNFEKPRYHWPLHLVWMASLPMQNGTGVFKLIGPMAEYVLGVEDSSVWIKRIQEAIKKHMETLAESQDESLAKEREANMNWDDTLRYGTYAFPEGHVYTGQWVDGKFEGQGQYEFMGNSYTGAWQGSMRNGQGKMVFMTGDEYEGAWRNDKQEGTGKHVYPNGDMYTGDWLEGRRQGKGLLKLASGATYNGEWQQNLPHGAGEMVYPTGESYKGSWVSGLRSGTGCQVCQNGETYEGEWANDLRHGKGKLVAGDTSYDGAWKDGKFHGRGRYTSRIGTYDGDWVSGDQEGQGTIRYVSGIEYRGQWRRNHYYGTGTITYQKGMVRSYMGDWKDNKKNGTGILQLFNDDVYDGHFKDNQLHGTGTYTWKTGLSLKSKWIRSSLSNGDGTLSLPNKEEAGKKTLLTGAFIDGRFVAPGHPVIFLPNFPAIDIS